MTAQSPQFAPATGKPLSGAAAPAQQASIDPAFADRADILQTVSFYMALAMVFTKFSFLQEIQTWVMHFKGYILYIVGIPAGVTLLLSGGLRRGMAGKPAYLWVAFTLWVVACVPFSTWRAASFVITRNFIEYSMLMLFIISGLVISWRQCRLLTHAIALAALMNILTANLFASERGGRFELEFGTVSNANDFAAHLLLTLPFLLLFASNSKSFVLRAIALLAVGFGVIVIFRTGSRGALVALVADVLFVLWRGTVRQRAALAMLAPIALIAVTLFVSGGVLQRIRSFSSSQAGSDAGAMESSDARRYLLTKAIEYTLTHPIFGIGPDQFANYEGSHNKIIGTHGMWHAVHNSFLQAFAETGFPGGILLIACYVSTWLLLNRTYRQARARPECRDIQITVFYIMLSMLGFCIAIFFLNFTFYYYGPALAGMALSVSRAAKYEFEHRVPLPAATAFIPPARIRTSGPHSPLIPTTS